MQCYSELIPPSGVTHAVHASFTSAGASNLIVARTSVLQIFTSSLTTSGQDTKLLLVSEEHLSGTITSVGIVKVLSSKSGGEALLVAFRDAKLSLIEWDPVQHCISTISIHYYENEDSLLSPWAPDLRDCASHLTIDPGSRCAAFNFGVSRLAVIPFHQPGDDLAMDDFDDMPNGVDDATSNQANGHLLPTKPYAASYVLPVAQLDANLLYPIDLAFLHEYREPTLGVLFSSPAKSTNLLVERKDVVTYAVHALDLEQQASTPLMTIPNLPNDLYAVTALPLPVSGVLLIGANELIHIDQGGKSTAIGVNEMARQTTSFSMADRSELSMRLEGCQIQPVDNAAGDMLVILASGEAAVLRFRLDGRTVSSMNMEKLTNEHHADFMHARASCMTTFVPGRIFIGSVEGDSILIGTAKKSSQLRRQSSRPHVSSDGLHEEPFDDMAEVVDEDEDELYGHASIADRVVDSNGSVGSLNFRILDRLLGIAPVRDVCVGRVAKRKRDEIGDDGLEFSATLQLAAATGANRTGAITFFSRELSPKIVSHAGNRNVSGVWAFPVKRLGKLGQREEDSFDDHIILSKDSMDDSGESSLFTISDGRFLQKQDTEFDSSAGTTVEVGGLRGGNFTVQILETEVRVYDFDFKIAQIYPINEEDSEFNAKAIKAVILDPVVVILKNDDSILFLKADKTGELDELELPTSLAKQGYQSITLYDDHADFFDTRRFYQQKPANISGNLLLGLLTIDGKFRIFSLPNIKIEVFAFDNLPFLPSMLSAATVIPKHWKNKDSLAEILLADIGDSIHRSPYLVIRNEIGDLTVYSPFAIAGSVGTFAFRKIATKIAKAPADSEADTYEPSMPQPRSLLRAARKIGGYSVVFSIGSSPAVVLKDASSSLQIQSLHMAGIKTLSSYNDAECPHGFIFACEDGKLCKAQFPQDTNLSLPNWSISRIPLGQDVSALAYYQRTHSYVAVVNEACPFQLPHDDEWHPEWQTENTSFLPRVGQSILKLINPVTKQLITEHRFDETEQVICIKAMTLEASEVTHEKKELIVVGTALIKGESVTSRGNIHIFDIVDVVPMFDVPDTNLRFKLMCKEEVKGAVTAVCPIGSQGFFLAAQGQKCMVRGLKEDNTILPVAFMDMRYHVTVAKELPGTGLAMLGDGFSGLWLTGYSEEPYKLQLLGRDMADPEVQVAEFLPDGKQLYIVFADTDGQLRIMQYDPENPKSERGARLLDRSTFQSGHFPTTMTLLPRIPVSSDLATLPTSSSDMDVDLGPYARYQILITTAEGSLALITPLSDASYRRLSTLQNILTTNLDHSCGLNPRAYRAVETDGIGGLGMIDGNLVRRWMEQSSQHKGSTADKAGGTVWDVRADLEAVGGAGLGFF